MWTRSVILFVPGIHRETLPFTTSSRCPFVVVVVAVCSSFRFLQKSTSERHNPCCKFLWNCSRSGFGQGCQIRRIIRRDLRIQFSLDREYFLWCVNFDDSSSSRFQNKSSLTPWTFSCTTSNPSNTHHVKWSERCCPLWLSLEPIEIMELHNNYWSSPPHSPPVRFADIPIVANSSVVRIFVVVVFFSFRLGIFGFPPRHCCCGARCR